MKIAYMMSRFPKLTETFILYEMLAIEKEDNVQVEVYPLIKERVTLVQEEARDIVDQAHYQPFISPQVLLSNFIMILRQPTTYFKTLWISLWATRKSRRFFTGILAFYLKSVHFARLMKSRDINHLHAHFASHPAAVAFIIHQLSGIPYSFTAHGSDLHRDQAMLCEKVRSAKSVIAISQYNKDMIIDHCGQEYADRIHVVHCGINIERFQPTGYQSEETLKILCVGSLHEVKGQHFLIEACAQLHQWHIPFECHFIGIGDDLEMLQALAKKNDIEDYVHFHGGKTQQEVITWLHNVDVFALTSVPSQDGRREGIPVALMEAMACGLPVISTHLSGIPELVTDSIEGYLTQPRDVMAIAESLKKLAQSTDLRQQLGDAARNKILDEFELESNAKRLLSIIENN